MNDDLNALQTCLEETFEQVNLLTIHIEQNKKVRLFQGIVHRCPQNYFILELEPTTEPLN